MDYISFHPRWLNAEEYGGVAWALQEAMKQFPEPSESIKSVEEDIQFVIENILEENPVTDGELICVPKPSSESEMAKVILETFAALSHLTEPQPGYKKEFIVLRLLFIQLLNDLQDRARENDS
tara:strand:- start:103 stop:471 length:369 start_codon:yes stop_codon:yes gene_type:complete